MAEGRLLRLLRALHESGVEFVLVGGLSGALNGAPIHTEDVDIVHRRDPGNITRLLTVLDNLDARYRAHPECPLRPTASHLASDGHQNLTTRLGWLDVLGALEGGMDYAALLPHSHELEVGDGVRIRVLDLETYIGIKEKLGGEKDRAVLPVLRQTLRERQRLERD